MQPGSHFLSLVLFFFLLPFNGISQEKNIKIRFVQEDSVYEPDADLAEISLRKKAFKIQVLLQNISGIYVFTSLSDTMYNLLDTEPVPGFSDLPDKLMTEDNKEKEITVSNDGWCYWSNVPGASPCGFNKKMILLDSGRVVGIKSIKQLYFLPSGKTLKLKDNRAPVYIFFVAVDGVDSRGKPMRELVRRKIKIDWLDDED
jgi:hypothetical protein